MYELRIFKCCAQLHTFNFLTRMIQIGKWLGWYTFDNSAFNLARGFDKTSFEIEILTIDQGKFAGKVQDVLSTGGTEGVGDIIGEVNGDNVRFVKRMPVMTLLIGKEAKRKTLNRKHRPIYYSGKFSDDKKSISGQWRFKFGIFFYGILPVLAMPTKGTWVVELKE